VESEHEVFLQVIEVQSVIFISRHLLICWDLDWAQMDSVILSL
jgi:hypothetical protein